MEAADSGASQISGGVPVFGKVELNCLAISQIALNLPAEISV
jgi:hypothetical protein